MNKIKRVTAAMMAALVITTTAYNIYTVPVNAAGMTITGYLLGDLLVEALLGAGAVYLGKETIDRVDLRNSMTSFLETPEGYAALLALNVKTVDGKTLNVGESIASSGSPSSNDPNNIHSIIAYSAIAGICIDVAYFNFLHLFFDNVTDSESESAVGAAINEASNQEITYAPFPENIHFSSVENPVYNPESVELFQAKYSQFLLEGNSFVQIYTPFSYDTFIVCSPDVSAYLFFRIDRLVVYYGASTGIYGSGSGVSVYNFMRNLQTDELGFRTRSGSYTAYGDLSEIYICGNVSFPYGNATYVLNPDGSIYQVVDGVSSVQVKPHLETAEGYLTSVRPIVKMDISALVDAIGKAIADAHPEEDLVLTPQAVDQIYNDVSNYYDNAVSNYYNDTSYLTQNDYITSITNIYEQAIADNPAVDVPVTDTTGILAGIKAVPGQIVEGIKDLIIPDTAVLSGYMVSLLGHFSWAIEPWNLFQDLIDIIFVGMEPPVIYIDLSMAKSSYNYGGKTVLIDFAFWEPYKPVADAVIVGFCWIWFLLWLFRNLPEIIHGSSPVSVWRASERAEKEFYDNRKLGGSKTESDIDVSN